MAWEFLKMITHKGKIRHKDRDIRVILIWQGLFATSLLMSCRTDLGLRINNAASVGGQGK